MKQKFIDKAFNKQSLETIGTLNRIIVEYSRQGYTLSLRQLYYQMVARGLIENSLQSYKRLGNLVSDARLAGLIDWQMIEDRNRETIAPPMWKNPAQIVKAAAAQFAIDRWKDQEFHVEVMVEKAALEGVLIPVCREQGVRFTANRGYSSSSAMYEVGQRLRHSAGVGKEVHILYLGDHDPSGIDMTRDVKDRLELFSDEEICVKRLALNMDQVEQLNPPENPAKTTDSRYGAYIEQFGESSWELDAVEPAELARLVTNYVIGLRDADLWDAALEKEAAMRERLEEFANQYEQDNPDEE